MEDEWPNRLIAKIRNFINGKIGIKSSNEYPERDTQEKNNLTSVIEG